jgi:hypothetical protein
VGECITWLGDLAVESGGVVVQEAMWRGAFDWLSWFGLYRGVLFQRQPPPCLRNRIRVEAGQGLRYLSVTSK